MLGIALVLVLPELGLPLLVVGLRLLALRYAWAARAYLPVARLWAESRRCRFAAKLAIGRLPPWPSSLGRLVALLNDLREADERDDLVLVDLAVVELAQEPDHLVGAADLRVVVLDLAR